MHNTALQPYGCAEINARRVHMPRLIMHTFQYLVAARKETP